MNEAIEVKVEIKSISALKMTVDESGEKVSFNGRIPNLEAFRRLVALQKDQNVGVVVSCAQMPLEESDKPQGAFDFTEPGDVRGEGKIIGAAIGDASVAEGEDGLLAAVCFDPKFAVDAETLAELMKSYSADKIKDNKIKKPVFIQGHNFSYICTSIVPDEYVETYRLVLSDDKRPEPPTDQGDLGQFHNCVVSYRNKYFVMIGPPVRFVDEAKEDEPDDLFDGDSKIPTDKVQDQIEENKRRGELYPDPVRVRCLGNSNSDTSCGHEKAFISWQEACPQCGVANWCDAEVLKS